VKVLQISKYPPIQGGVSAECFWLAQTLSELGHAITVLTNADEVEPEYKVSWTTSDKEFCERQRGDYPVVVVSTITDHRHYYIPAGTPVVSKLVSTGLELVERVGPDVIFSSYLEPYGVAGAFLSAVTGVPHATSHGGSDVGRLMKTRGLAKCHEMVFNSACAVVTNRGDQLRIPAEKRIPATSIRLRSDIFYPVPSEKRKKVVLGIYGKVGRNKGTTELLTVVSRLIAKGIEIGLMCLWGRQGMDKVSKAISDLGIASSVQISPFVPHWRIPQFIWACDAILFLENNFPIAEHYPLAPLEALSCGRPVLLTEEIARKGIYKRLVQEAGMPIVAAPFSADTLEIAIIDLLGRLPALQALAMSAVDVFARSESAIWTTADQFERVFELCNCSPSATA
jgi:glycosyltransferase involved in cell wall biosynthesis